MRNVPPFLRMVWRVHRGYTLAIVALGIFRALLPLAALWVGKLIADLVVDAARFGQPDWRRLATPCRH